jgi:hypothetical protein
LYNTEEKCDGKTKQATKQPSNQQIVYYILGLLFCHFLICATFTLAGLFEIFMLRYKKNSLS